MDTKDIRKNEYPEFVTPNTEIIGAGLGQAQEKKVESAPGDLEIATQNLNQQTSEDTAALAQAVESVPVARTEASVVPLAEKDQGPALEQFINGDKKITPESAAQVMQQVLDADRTQTLQ